MFADKINPTALGTADNNDACSTGLSSNGVCLSNELGVRMLTGVVTDNVLAFRTSDQAGLMIGTCYGSRGFVSFCAVYPTYTRTKNCYHVRNLHIAFQD
ncbi:hypothetical protein PFISCL1PPCAC_873 [Pristionchus fissidentatus]|uniref:Uncharacterized protein n=1 Tax=Pristionchus fissidentatus TaxID=1538716 RepID=A0AAV5USZ0_9BILA|nr:hypothetical protein PFISCL1PPCAC_873 [Pristionchus fissidentatus]